MTFNPGYQGGYPQVAPQAQGKGNGQGFNNSGYDNHVKIQVIGRIVTDPVSEMKQNGSRLARSKIAVNHRGSKQETDFWFIEVWGNENADSVHNFLVNHCGKGRRVFIEGTPHLNSTQDENGNWKTFPTIKIEKIVGLDGGSGQSNGNQNGRNINQQQNMMPTGQFQPENNYQPNNAQPMQGGFPQPTQPNQMQNGFPPNMPGQQPAFNSGPVGAPNVPEKPSQPVTNPGGFGYGGYPNPPKQ